MAAPPDTERVRRSKRQKRVGETVNDATKDNIQPASLNANGKRRRSLFSDDTACIRVAIPRGLDSVSDSTSAHEETEHAKSTAADASSVDREGLRTKLYEDMRASLLEQSKCVVSNVAETLIGSLRGRIQDLEDRIDTERAGREQDRAFFGNCIETMTRKYQELHTRQQSRFESMQEKLDMLKSTRSRQNTLSEYVSEPVEKDHGFESRAHEKCVRKMDEIETQVHDINLIVAGLDECINNADRRWAYVERQNGAVEERVKQLETKEIAIREEMTDIRAQNTNASADAEQIALVRRACEDSNKSVQARVEELEQLHAGSLQENYQIRKRQDALQQGLVDIIPKIIRTLHSNKNSQATSSEQSSPLSIPEVVELVHFQANRVSDNRTRISAIESKLDGVVAQLDAQNIPSRSSALDPRVTGRFPELTNTISDIQNHLRGMIPRETRRDSRLTALENCSRLLISFKETTESTLKTLKQELENRVIFSEGIPGCIQQLDSAIDSLNQTVRSHDMALSSDALGTLKHRLESHLEAQQSQVEGRIASVERKIDTQADALDTRIKTEVDSMERKLKSHDWSSDWNKLIAHYDTRLTKLEPFLEEIPQAHSMLSSHIAKLQTRNDKLHGDLLSVKTYREKDRKAIDSMELKVRELGRENPHELRSKIDDLVGFVQDYYGDRPDCHQEDLDPQCKTCSKWSALPASKKLVFQNDVHIQAGWMERTQEIYERSEANMTGIETRVESLEQTVESVKQRASNEGIDFEAKAWKVCAAFQRQITHQMLQSTERMYVRQDAEVAHSTTSLRGVRSPEQDDTPVEPTPQPDGDAQSTDDSEICVVTPDTNPNRHSPRAERDASRRSEPTRRKGRLKRPKLPQELLPYNNSPNPTGRASASRMRKIQRELLDFNKASPTEAPSNAGPRGRSQRQECIR
ncbi:hypothetical protein EJ04DRAFT_561516 [Polyplosphaeria fusca]|uniref:Uncharacterized protein n=1 Tax=Polyplosphaeria fusca TaxID=682080 RepID=A0A9P4R5Y0_9PLEO|nr:hypothetical protein EJ04DRAFT_561516 [Polyplosphaeria fusca]